MWAGFVGGRMYVRVMSGTAVREALSALLAAHDALVACDFDTLTKAESVEFSDALETLGCRLPTLSHRLLAQLQAVSTAREMGERSWKKVLALRWRISTGEAGRRLALAKELGPRRALTGQPLEPLLPATAVAAALGSINAEHVAVIRSTMGKLPGFVDPATATQIEVDLVRTAVGHGPKELRDVAELRLLLLDQDGPPPDDEERDRKRGITVGKQGQDLLSALIATLTPELRALLEAVWAKYAAPGMCNPGDPQPCTSGTPSQAQIDGDHRSLAQRQHDALIAVLRIAVMSGELGMLGGLPVSVIITVTKQDLESAGGIGVSGGGTTLSIRDVDRLAGHANLYLAVFDGASGKAVNLYHTRRLANPAQRIMLIARDRGCSKPGCTVGPYGCQVHHADADFAVRRRTHVDELTLACGADNRDVNADGGWSTSMNARTECEWAPPPQLDTGQHRINYYHRPDRLTRPPDDDVIAVEAAPLHPDSGCTGDPSDPWAPVAPSEPATEGQSPEPEPLDPWADSQTTTTDEPEPPQPSGYAECRQPEPSDPWADLTPTQPHFHGDNHPVNPHRTSRSPTPSTRNDATRGEMTSPLTSPVDHHPRTAKSYSHQRSAARLALGSQLPTGSSDFTPTRVPHRAGDPALPNPLHELPLGRLGTGIPLAPGRRVERNEVDVHQRPEGSMEALAQEIGTPRLVVDVADQCIFDGDSSTCHVRVIPCRIECFADIPSIVDGNQGVAQLVVGRMQRQRQGDAQTLVGELPNRGRQADRRYGDRPRGDPEALRRGSDDSADRGEHTVVVGERLTHAHEDDVGQPVVVLVAHGRRRSPNLLENLCGGEVSGQPALARRAEWTCHAAARLRGDAHGVPLRVAHQHRFERRAVGRTPERLARFARIAFDLTQRIDQGGEQGVRYLIAHRRREIRHLVRVGDEPAVVLVGKLLGPEGG